MIGTGWLVLLAVVAATECYHYATHTSFYNYRRSVAPRAPAGRQKGARDLYTSTARKDFDTVDDLIAPEMHIKIHGDLINLWEDVEDDKKTHVKAKDDTAMCARTKRAAKQRKQALGDPRIPTKKDIEKPLGSEEDKRSDTKEDAPIEDVKQEDGDLGKDDPDEKNPDEEQPEEKEATKKDDDNAEDNKRSRVFGDYVRREEKVDVNSIYYLAALSQREKEKLAGRMAEEFFERHFRHVADLEEDERMKCDERLREIILAIAEELQSDPRAEIPDDLLAQLKDTIRKADGADDS